MGCLVGSLLAILPTCWQALSTRQLPWLGLEVAGGIVLQAAMLAKLPPRSSSAEGTSPPAIQQRWRSFLLRSRPAIFRPEARCLLVTEGEQGHVVEVVVAGAGHLGCVYLDDDHFGEELDLGG